MRSPPPPAMLTWRSLHLVDTAVSAELNALLGEHAGCSLTDHDVLTWLAVAPGRRLRMRDLAARLRMTAGGLTRVTDRLVTRGWVSRETPEENRREVHITLTDEGKLVLAKARRVYSRTVEATFSEQLADADLAVLDRIAARLLAHLGLDGLCRWDHDAAQGSQATQASTGDAAG